jgi:hypothetical protein
MMRLKKMFLHKLPIFTSALYFIPAYVFYTQSEYCVLYLVEAHILFFLAITSVLTHRRTYHALRRQPLNDILSELDHFFIKMSVFLLFFFPQWLYALPALTYSIVVYLTIMRTTDTRVQSVLHASIHVCTALSFSVFALHPVK